MARPLHLTPTVRKSEYPHNMSLLGDISSKQGSRHSLARAEDADTKMTRMQLSACWYPADATRPVQAGSQHNIGALACLEKIENRMVINQLNKDGYGKE